jgi:hypothetical protein
LTLQDYLTQTRYFLRDSQSVFWQDPQLITWINKARNEVVRDTNCTRALAVINLVQGQELYSFQLVLSAIQVNGAPASSILSLNGIGLNWVANNLRFDLNRASWKRFSAYLRALPQFQTFPLYWSMYDQQSFYVAPIPNQAYTCECDAIYLPNPLVNYTDTEAALPQPFPELVPLLAAKWSKYFEQAYKESDAFFQQYIMERNMLMATQPSQFVPSEYDNDDLD